MIISMFKSIFGGNETISFEGNGGHAAPGTDVRFDDQLINKLQNDHQSMLKIFTKIVKDVKNNKRSNTLSDMSALSRELRKHVLLEHVKLYVYLLHSTANDVTTQNIILEYRNEMSEIIKEWDKLIKLSNNMSTNKLAESLDEVGAIVVERIRREETTLYPIYSSL